MKRLTTPRRLEILQLAAHGYSNAEIGRRLYIAEDSVKSNLRLAYIDLGARDRAHAVVLLIRAGLLDPADVQPAPAKARTVR